MNKIYNILNGCILFISILFIATFITGKIIASTNNWCPDPHYIRTDMGSPPFDGDSANLHSGEYWCGTGFGQFINDYSDNILLTSGVILLLLIFLSSIFSITSRKDKYEQNIITYFNTHNLLPTIKLTQIFGFITITLYFLIGFVFIFQLELQDAYWRGRWNLVNIQFILHIAITSYLFKIISNNKNNPSIYTPNYSLEFALILSGILFYIVPEGNNIFEDQRSPIAWLIYILIPLYFYKIAKSTIYYNTLIKLAQKNTPNEQIKKHSRLFLLRIVFGLIILTIFIATAKETMQAVITGA